MIVSTSGGASWLITLDSNETVLVRFAFPPLRLDISIIAPRVPEDRGVLKSICIRANQGLVVLQ